jgi:hypothetical protein
VTVALPCLSIRQPWAWAILNVGKDVENRSWTTTYRGPLLIHAAKGCPRDEYDDACDFIDRASARDGECIRIDVPALADLERGGIVGAAHLFGMFPQNYDRNTWKIPGQFGWRLGGATRLPFREYRGALGLFRVELTASEVIDLRLAGSLKAEACP